MPRPPMPKRTLIACAALIFLLSACGQRGPLYLPDKSPPPAQATDVENASDIPEGQSPDGQDMPEFDDGPIGGPAAVEDDDGN